MIPLRDNYFSRNTALVTYTLVGLNVLIYFWDRGMGAGSVFADFAMRPNEVVAVLQGKGDPTSMVTVFTSLFLHGNLMHLISNVIFLLAFGENVEAALGSVRYALYYLAWGILASATHVFVDPYSPIPTLGASGAIGGVLGAYFLLFPGNRIRYYIFPILFHAFSASAWVLLGLWFAFQIFVPQQGVANWAHAGGFLAGMLTILMLGGREKVLENVRLERDPEADED